MNKLIKNYLYNIVSLLTGTLFPFVTFPYVSRVLMPEYLGKVMFTQSFINYFIILALLGIPTYGIRELSRVKDKNKQFSKKFTELFLISLISSLVSFIIFQSFILLNKELYIMKNIMNIYSLQILFAFLNIDYIFIVLENHKRRTIRTVILRVVSLILILTQVKTSSDYLIYAIILVLPEIIARFLDIYMCKNYICFYDLEFKVHFKSLFMIFLYLLSVGIYLNLDTTMLGFIKTQREVGLYSTASKFVKMIVPILSVLGVVMAPKIINYIKNNKKDKLYISIDIFIDFTIFLGVPASLILIFFSEKIILLISGKEFIAANFTMKIISLMLIFLPIGTFFGGQILLPNDKEKVVFKVAIIGMLSNIFLNLLLIPNFGIHGAAIATVFTEILICLYRGYEVKKIYNDYIFITKERICYILVGVISFIVVNLLVRHINNLFILVICYGILYILSLILLKDKNIELCLKNISKYIKNRKE